MADTVKYVDIVTVRSAYMPWSYLAEWFERVARDSHDAAPVGTLHVIELDRDEDTVIVRLDLGTDPPPAGPETPRPFDLVHAPFSDEQVRSLELWQANPHVHPFTCPSDEHATRSLTPTAGGWICLHVGCYRTQTWAYRIMLDSTLHPTAPW